MTCAEYIAAYLRTLGMDNPPTTCQALVDSPRLISTAAGVDLASVYHSPIIVWGVGTPYAHAAIVLHSRRRNTYIDLVVADWASTPHADETGERPGIGIGRVSIRPGMQHNYRGSVYWRAEHTSRPRHDLNFCFLWYTP